MCEWNISGDGIERTKLMDVDLFGFVEDGGFREYMPRFCNTIWDGGVCYMLLERENCDQRELYYLASDGKMMAIPIDHVQSLLCAQDQRIIYARSSENGTRIEAQNIETGTIDVLLETQADLSKSYYCAEEQAIYYMSDLVYRVEVSNPQNKKAVGKCPFSQCSGLLCSDENLVFYNRNQILADRIRDLDSIHKLNLAGYIGDLNVLYSKQYPDMVLNQTRRLNGYEITSNMLVHNSEVDIYIISPDDNQSFKALRDRGFCIPLTNPAITELSNTLYDEIRNELYDRDGNMCALPMGYATGITLGINTALWNDLGFKDIPQSWDDFFVFLETEWRTYNKENVDVRLMPYSTAEETQAALFYMLKANYENYRKQTGDKERYSSNVYQTLLNRFLSIDFEEFQYGDDTTPCLLTDWYLITPSGISSALSMGIDYLPLSIDEKVEQELVQYLGFVFINPYSDNQDAAQEFMGFLAENISAEEKIMIQSENTTAIKSDVYDEIFEMYNAEATRLYALYDAAGDAEKYQIQQAIEANESNLQENIRNGGYIVSPDGVTLYKKLISENGRSIQYHNENTNSFNQVVELSKQLMQKQINVEKYTSELDRLLVQEELENQ